MGKKGTWFSAVKKAFRSPSKDKDYVKTTPKDLDLVGDLPPVEVRSLLLHHFFSLKSSMNFTENFTETWVSLGNSLLCHGSLTIA